MDRIKILIADDEKEITDLIELYLKNEGYETFTAYNGSDALKLLEEHTMHLVILDIMMPGIDGLETCQRIRRDNNIPIIMLSAKSEDIDKIMGLSTGADDYMTKPFNPLELIARVKSQREISMECRLDIVDGQYMLTADANMLARVFENINANAVRYGSDGKYIDISLKKANGRLVAEVTNYGNPIPQYELPHIFEKFYRVEHSRSENTGGTGLGLQ